MSLGRAARIAGRMTRSGATAASALVLLASLAACGRFGDPLQALGARLPSPDEFQVIEYEPPVVPETYSLPEPRLGAPSPRAPNPQSAAVTALLGPEAAARTAPEPSRGEQALLGAANAASTSGDIRVQLEEEKRQAEASQPYEPPLLWDVLGLTSSESREQVDESQVIDPQVESERLQREGAPTTVDPEAAARAEAKAEREAREAEADTPGVFGRPSNRTSPPWKQAY